MTEKLGDVEIGVTPKNDPKAARRAGEQFAEGVEDGAESKASGVGKTFATGMVAGVGLGLAANLPGMVKGFAGELFGLADSMEQIGRRAEVVFGDNLEQARAATDRLNESLGLSETAALGAAAGIQDILVPMGFARDEATGMSVDLLELGGALAGNTGGLRTAEEAHQALIAALTGERESLKAYGVVLNEEMVKQQVATNIANGITHATDQQAKAFATLQLTTEASGDAISLWNDRAGTMSEEANKARARLAESKEELARGLQPVMLAGVGLLADFAGGLSTATGFLVENKEAVVVLTAALAAYKGAQALGGAVTATRNFATAHGSLAAGLKASLAKMNPWGIAAAGAVAVATAAIFRWRDAQEEAKAKVRELNEGLKNQHGHLDLLTDDWNEWALESSEWADNNQTDDLQRMNLTFGDLNDMMARGRNGLNEYLQAMVASEEITLAHGVSTAELASQWEHLDITNESVKDGLWETVAGNTNLVDSYEEQIKTTARAIQQNLEAIVVNDQHSQSARDTAAAILDVDAAAIDLVEFWHRDMLPALAESDEAMADNEGAAGANADAHDGVTAALEDEKEAAGETRTEIEELTEKYGTLTDVVDEAKSAIDRMKGGKVELDEASIALNADLDDLTGTLAENVGSFDIGTEAGRANMEQARQTAESIRELELALIGNGTSAEEAAKFTDAYRESLGEQLTAAGLAEESVDALIGTYSDIPDEIRTAIIADAEQALADAARYDGVLGRIPRTVHTTFTSSGNRARHGGVQAFADGGRPPVRTPVLVGEEGPELVEFGSGANIIPATETATRLGSAGGGMHIEQLVVQVEASADLTRPETAREWGSHLRDALISLEREDA